jgi:hypothetical protein
VKTVLFLASHIGSGSNLLFDALTSSDRIEGFRTGMSYDHYDKIESLLSNPHKNNKSNSIFLDELLYNHSFVCKPLIPRCKFVYLLREPRGALSSIMSSTDYDLDMANRYYRYRLRGLCEYAIRSSGYVLTYDRLGDLSGLSRYLGIKDVFQVSVPPETCVEISDRVLAECDRSYEKYLRDLMQHGCLT